MSEINNFDGHTVAQPWKSECLPPPQPCIPDLCVPDAMCDPTQADPTPVPTHSNAPKDKAESSDTTFMWLELTGKCQLECSHCYAGSGPQGEYGSVDTEEWKHIIDGAAEAGVQRVQFIGGEPTARNDFSELLRHSLDRGLATEVYSNLFALTPRILDALRQPGVAVATSYYSSKAETHDAITKKAGSHERTKTNIARIVEEGIPIRVGLVDMQDDQDVQGATEDLVAMGVPRDKIRIDRMREVGRGERDEGASMEQLCGACATTAAVMPDGTVKPCVFARWLDVGNATEQSMNEILNGETLRETRQQLDEAFAARSDKPSAE